MPRRVWFSCACRPLVPPPRLPCERLHSWLPSLPQRSCTTRWADMHACHRLAGVDHRRGAAVSSPATRLTDCRAELPLRCHVPTAAAVACCHCCLPAGRAVPRPSSPLAAAEAAARTRGALQGGLCRPALPVHQYGVCSRWGYVDEKCVPASMPCNCCAGPHVRRQRLPETMHRCTSMPCCHVCGSPCPLIAHAQAQTPRRSMAVRAQTHTPCGPTTRRW